MHASNGAMSPYPSPPTQPSTTRSTRQRVYRQPPPPLPPTRPRAHPPPPPKLAAAGILFNHESYCHDSLLFMIVLIRDPVQPRVPAARAHLCHPKGAPQPRATALVLAHIMITRRARPSPVPAARIGLPPSPLRGVVLDPPASADRPSPRYISLQHTGARGRSSTRRYEPGPSPQQSRRETVPDFTQLQRGRSRAPWPGFTRGCSRHCA